ncbi:gamma-glutamylcyclotransferase family protein, partial [Litorivivens sp.]
MANLFCYGTLMYTPLLEALVGRECTVEPATLPDFACYGVKAAAYPAVIEQAGAQVRGVLVRDIPPGGWQALDRYEGEYYRREPVQVTLDDGREL